MGVTLDLIKHRLLQQEGLRAGLLRLNLDGFLRNYQEHVGNDSEVQEMQAEEWLRATKTWCDNYYPPATIETNVLQLLSKVQAEGSASGDLDGDEEKIAA